MAVFRKFLSNAFYGYSGFAKEVTPCSYTLKLLFQGRFSFRGMHDKPSLFSSRYLGRNGCQADYEKLKITLEQKTISQISCCWDNILVTLTLECGPSSSD